MTTDMQPTGSRSELRDLVRSQLEILLAQKNFEGAKTLLRPVQEVDIAEAIEGLPQSMQVIAFRLLPKAEAIEVYEHLSSDIQQSLIEQFRDQEALEVVEKMSPDDRVSLFDELPPRLVRRMLSQLSTEERRTTSLLLGYRANTAGRLMTPKFISLQADLTVAKAQERVRQKARDAELSYYIYVTDAAKKLVGTVSFRDLVLAYPDQIIADIMGRDVVYADTDTDQEEVADLIARYDLIALPIVDREQNLLGVVTVDDVLDIVQEEATEDIYKMGAVQAVGENYFESGLLAGTQKRILWLIILLLISAVTIFILSSYTPLLSRLLSLTFFVPLLIDAGGNVGAQSSTVVIRGLSTDELRYRQPVGVLLQELFSGGLLSG
ncbi:MAG TPA: magnesium transporter, partial [Trichocoleus sp.]